MSQRVAATNNLAYCFQEVLTSILRVRYQGRIPADAATFRTMMQRLLQGAMTEAKALGYTSQSIQMSVLATVGFLDESVLNLRSGAVAEWTRRPLQEELFGGHVAGETVFSNIAQLLQQQDSAEVADVLELHCLCLELGYKGRYAFGSGGEIRQIIAQCRAKITRIRGGSALFTLPVVAPFSISKSTDLLGRGLLISTIVLAVLTVAAFAGYELSLSSGASRLSNNSLVLR